ncbi:hypothetical protein CDAR_424341 [Caerostris darwini]|uniref:Uncharacterized protein n=1 Tax=Caerostris darwini TaxID=1538125 RepID=A0AAV4T0I8_9ARAC|nr:hypothetical protein CDAR_424341 [Caerostris darwini]
MEVSNEPAGDPFPKTTSKGSFAPTEIKGNDDTLKIRNEERTLKGAPSVNFFPFSNSSFVRMKWLAGWRDGSPERAGRRSVSQDDIKGIICSNRDQRQRQHSQNKVARRILLHESLAFVLSTDLS